MSLYDRFKLVGTSHISSQSLDAIKKGFLEFTPDGICVELDSQRLYALLHPNQKADNWALLKQLGVMGFLFAKISRYAQQKLGKIVGMQAGSDMLFAVELAKNNSLDLYLIDQHIEKTIKRLMKQITFREKIRFIKDLFLGLFFKKSQPKVKINLHEVPSTNIIGTLLDQLKIRYPTIHRVLVDERNHFMAKQLVTLLKKYPEKKLLVVIGAGHEKEINSLVERYDKKIEIL